MADKWTGVPDRVRTWIETSRIDLEAVFGPGTEPKHISFCAHSPDTCGCTREFAWSRASHEDNRVEVPVSSPVVCKHHQHLETMHDHHNEVVAENKHKNVAHDIVVKNLHHKHRVEHKDENGAVVAYTAKEPIRFFYSKDRELHFDLDHIPEAERVDVQPALDRHFKSRRTFVKRDKKG